MTTQLTFNYQLFDYKQMPEDQILNVPILVPVGGHYQTHDAVYVVFEHNKTDDVITPLCQRINNKGFTKV